MSHIYTCQYMNKEETMIPYKKIYNGKVSEKTKIYKRFESNMNRKNELKIKSEQEKKNERDFPCDQIIDLLHFVQSSIG